MAHEVRLEVFEGPIDLLLTLVSRRRVDIYDVSLATITDDYLRAIEGMEALDLEAATGFLVVAATLLELKAARLLPAAAPEEDYSHLLEERDRLLARLVQCSTFRRAGAWISDRLSWGEAFVARVAGLEPQFAAAAPDPLPSVQVADIAGAAAKSLASHPPPELDTSHLTPLRVSVERAVEEVASRLEHAGEVSFRELCAGITQRLEVVVRLLALLELYKAGAVDLWQAERFGDIRASWTGEAVATGALEDVDEYAAPDARV